MGVVTSAVTSAFSNASTYAAAATAQAATFIDTMNDSIYTPPTLTLTWTSLPAPTIPGLPSTPTLPTIAFTEPSGKPADLTLDDLTVVFDEFADPAPTLEFPTAPSVTTYTAPTIPDVAAVTVPDAPTVATVAVPTLLSINTVTFDGINLHEDWLTDLQNIPTLTLVEPTPYSYTPGPEYASDLLTAMQAKLVERLAGGTGLSSAVEQAIWDRARDRETKTALANEQEVMRASEALGFQLPTGALAAQLREAQQAHYSKLSELSRDIAIKQAELEQENLKSAIAEGIQLESKLVDYSYQIERLAFESAKQYADNAIQIYNAVVEQYKALLAGYETYSANYKTLIEAELAKVEAYKGELQAESLKAQVNTALVEQYRAQVEAGLSVVKVYEAQVGAAQTLIQLEATKINAAGEQVRAYVAKMNGETAKVEAYKAGIEAESAKMNAYKIKVETFQTKIGAQAQQLQAELNKQNVQAQVYATKWEGWKSAVQAESVRMEALGKQSNALLDGYRAATSATLAEAQMNTTVWEGNMKQYEAGINATMQTAKINNDAAIMTNNARLDASKVGAQVFAQLASSAYGMAHATANLSGGQWFNVAYNYTGEASAEWTIDP